MYRPISKDLTTSRVEKLPSTVTVGQNSVLVNRLDGRQQGQFWPIYSPTRGMKR